MVGATTVRLSLAQFAPLLGDKAANLRAMQQQIEAAGKVGSGLILFPELALTGYRLEPEQLHLAEPIDGPSLAVLAETCRRCHVAALISFPERSGSQHYICAALIDHDGRMAGRYRKTHLYPGEERLFTPGDHLPVFETSLGRLGVLICYDLEFPEAARTLRLQGAEMILVATANMRPYASQQMVYLRARAFENEVPVALCNRVGHEGDLQFFGAGGLAMPGGQYWLLPEDETVLGHLSVRPDGADYGYSQHRRPALYQG